MLTDFSEWLLDLFLWLPRKVFQLLADGLSSFINMIPVPAFFQQADLGLNNIPAGIAYFLAPLQFGFAITVIISAYTLRFVLRRMPIIG